MDSSIEISTKELENFKGLHFISPPQPQFYLAGAHFDFKDLCSRLQKLNQMLNLSKPITHKVNKSSASPLQTKPQITKLSRNYLSSSSNSMSKEKTKSSSKLTKDKEPLQSIKETCPYKKITINQDKFRTRNTQNPNNKNNSLSYKMTFSSDRMCKTLNSKRHQTLVQNKSVCNLTKLQPRINFKVQKSTSETLSSNRIKKLASIPDKKVVSKDKKCKCENIIKVQNVKRQHNNSNTILQTLSHMIKSYDQGIEETKLNYRKSKIQATLAVTKNSNCKDSTERMSTKVFNNLPKSKQGNPITRLRKADHKVEKSLLFTYSDYSKEVEMITKNKIKFKKFP